MVDYLFANSEEGSYPPPRPGNVANGQSLVDTVGCHGCHNAIGPEAQHANADPRSHGPNLMRIGNKTDAGWLHQWVRNPKNYWTDTVMPDLRLTETEATDVTAYLASLDDRSWRSEYDEYFSVSQEHKTRKRGEMVLGYLMTKLTQAQAEAELATMSEAEQSLMVGQKTISRFGCLGCHDIPGFEDAQRIGTELTKEGSKYVDRLDFGFVDIPQERWDWFSFKIPRLLSAGRSRYSQ